MQIKVTRKSDKITLLGTNPPRVDKSIPLTIPATVDLRCTNCKERSYFVEVDDEPTSLFCTNCGHKTPLRTARHNRGLRPPAGQQEGTAIASAASNSDSSGHNRYKDRKPKSMLETHRDPAIDATLSAGHITIINSQTVVPK